MLWLTLVFALVLVAANERWHRDRFQAEVDKLRAAQEAHRQVQEIMRQTLIEAEGKAVMKSAGKAAT